MDQAEKLFAVRGATQAAVNSAEIILESAFELLKALIKENQLTPDDVLSAFFTVTPDLDAAFPAAAARQLGWERVAMLCSSEIPVPGALERVIRVLIQYHASSDHQPVGVYLGAAERLRPDLFPISELPDIEKKLLVALVEDEENKAMFHSQKQSTTSYLAQQLQGKPFPRQPSADVKSHLQHLTMERLAFYWKNEHGGGWCSTSLGRQVAAEIRASEARN